LFVDFIDYEIDHLASAVLLDKIYVLDQKLPPMDLGSYYNKWLREGKRIGGIVIYERDKKLMSFNESEIMAQNYKFTKRDLEELKNLLIEKLKRELAYGEFYYREKLIITMFFDGLADYYTPMFSEEIAEMIKERLLEKIEKKWKGFSLELEVSWPDIVLKLSLTN
ncbi:MAG: transglutaminase-like domain-containing protein, partial [Archaeoglobaceae archaeon]